MTKTDILLINKQRIVKTNRFAKNNKGQYCFSSMLKQLIPDFVSLCKNQVKQIFSKPPKGSKSGSLWRKYGTFPNIGIFLCMIMKNLSEAPKHFRYLFWRLLGCKNEPIFSVQLLLNICILSIFGINLQCSMP